jgi:hypothetical protein
MRSELVLRAIGHAARDALVASAGRLDAVTGFDIAPYARASGEVIWIGHGEVTMHPRAVVLARAAHVCVTDRLDARALVPWRPPPPPAAGATPSAWRSGCAALAGNLSRLPRPKGFAALLAGDVPPFPLDRTRARVHALARALDENDCESFRAAALPLLGLGPGLTPSGDDLVGAALFARRVMPASAHESLQWAALATRLIADAKERTHPIAAALFADLAMARTFAPLHRLANAIAAQSDDDAVIDAALALVAIGSSSGWEMLAGFMFGVVGEAMLTQTRETT